MVIMSDIKIKRCPFCGGLPVKSSNDNGEGFMDAWIECVNIKCEINPHVSDPNMHSALEFWNQRHDDNLTNQVAELRAVVFEANKYLDINNLTTIGHGSNLHEWFKQALELTLKDGEL